AAEPLGAPGAGWPLVERLLDRAAVLVAFEQLGGAQAAVDVAREYAIGRFAFGRQIASFQAIKHKLADMYVAVELARSNAYYGAWALSKDAPELPVAAATARGGPRAAADCCLRPVAPVQGRARAARGRGHRAGGRHRCVLPGGQGEHPGARRH